MLDTLRRLSMYGLLLTLFMLMLVTLSEAQAQPGLTLASMVLIGLINAGVIAVHLWACAREVRRWLLWSAGKDAGDKLTGADVKQFLADAVKPLQGAACCGGGGGRRGGGGGGAGAAGGAGSKVGQRAGGPPAESPVGDVHVVNPKPGGPVREGNVVVMNPKPPASDATTVGGAGAGTGIPNVGVASTMPPPTV